MVNNTVCKKCMTKNAGKLQTCTDLEPLVIQNYIKTVYNMECNKPFQRCTDTYGMRGTGICKILKDKSTKGMLGNVKCVVQV